MNLSCLERGATYDVCVYGMMLNVWSVQELTEAEGFILFIHCQITANHDPLGTQT